MGKQALDDARAKIDELVADLDLDDDVNTLTRSIQEAFKAWAAQRPDVMHETAQFFIRGHLQHLKKHRAADDLSDFERHRRTHPKSFYGYETRDGERRFPRGRGL